MFLSDVMESFYLPRDPDENYNSLRKSLYYSSSRICKTTLNWEYEKPNYPSRCDVILQVYPTYLQRSQYETTDSDEGFSFNSLTETTMFRWCWMIGGFSR